MLATWHQRKETYGTDFYSKKYQDYLLTCASKINTNYDISSFKRILR